MDPIANIARQRELAELVSRVEDDGSQPPLIATATELAELVFTLDVWKILADVQDSYELAMVGAGVDEGTRAEINATVEDYLANHYGDD